MKQHSRKEYEMLLRTEMYTVDASQEDLGIKPEVSEETTQVTIVVEDISVAYPVPDDDGNMNNYTQLILKNGHIIMVMNSYHYVDGVMSAVTNESKPSGLG